MRTLRNFFSLFTSTWCLHVPSVMGLNKRTLDYQVLLLAHLVVIRSASGLLMHHLLSWAAIFIFNSVLILLIPTNWLRADFVLPFRNMNGLIQCRPQLVGIIAEFSDFSWHLWRVEPASPMELTAAHARWSCASSSETFTQSFLRRAQLKTRGPAVRFEAFPEWSSTVIINGNDSVIKNVGSESSPVEYFNVYFISPLLLLFTPQVFQFKSRLLA